MIRYRLFIVDFILIVLCVLAVVLAVKIYDRVQMNKDEEAQEYQEDLEDRYSYLYACIPSIEPRETNGYVPYSNVDESQLYLQIAIYNWNNQDKEEYVSLALEDLNAFLSEEYTEEGTLLIFDMPLEVERYVHWYQCGGKTQIESYITTCMQPALTMLREQYPEYLIPEIEDMTIDQVNELFLYTQDPSTEIDMEVFEKNE